MASEYRTRVACVEWPEGLGANGATWNKVSEQVANAQQMDGPIDLLVTNELPFGVWIADGPEFDPEVAKASVEAHERGLEALSRLGVPTVLSSRPIWTGSRLANEAFVLEHGNVRALHRKNYFPDEPGWFETNWYCPGNGSFIPREVCGISLGVLLCTDAMFNEHARRYGRLGTDLIVIPRATGTSIAPWQAACQMAAIVSGSYVISSNRVGLSGGGTRFGGVGLAYHPDGSLIAQTSQTVPLHVIEVDPEVSARQRKEYPCYVRELS